MRGSIRIAEGDRRRLAATVSALRRSARYPGEAGDVEAIETHMAWVFLTEKHAYKLKKPIQTRLIDYRTIGARRRACETELGLNRRLAAPVYLDVVPVVDTGAGLCVGGDGPPVDWLVKMRRLPRRRMLDVYIEQGTVPEDAIRHLGAKLTRFYRRADPLGWRAGRYRGRIAANIRSKAASMQRPHYGLDRTEIQAVVAAQLRWIARRRALLGGRGEHVVDAHGDLRPEHVCLTDPPMVIDCLEFNRSLRITDPVCDLSFLSLECRRLGAGWIGDRVLARYRSTTEDAVATPLIPFYESYHALIRAAIAIWHLDDEDVERPDRWRDRAREYLRLARRRV